MFKGADIVLLNKIDYAKSEPFDLNNFSKGVKLQNKHTKIIQVSCRTDEGIDDWIDWITAQKTLSNTYP